MKHEPATSALRVTRVHTPFLVSQDNSLRRVDFPSGHVVPTSGEDRSAAVQLLPQSLGVLPLGRRPWRLAGPLGRVCSVCTCSTSRRPCQGHEGS